MTPEERDLVTELFDRLASLESTPRDPAAERAIIEGLRQAPNAVYSLVQTVLVQDEALKRADAHIRELEGGGSPAPQNTSFLGGMRDQVWGHHEATRAGSVPSVRPAAASGGISSAWRNTGAPAQPAQAAPAPEPTHGGMGGSFLGTAAAAAAGVVGGSLLMGGLRSMMGGHGPSSAFNPAAAAPRDASPWSDGGSGGGDLSRQAGLDDMGKVPGSQASGGSAGLFDGGDGSGDQQQDVGGEGGDDGDFDTDDGGDFSGGGDD